MVPGLGPLGSTGFHNQRRARNEKENGLVPALVSLGSAWFHRFPQPTVCKNCKAWFGSGLGSTWFRMLAEAPNLRSLSGTDLVPDLVPLGSTSRQGPGNLSSLFWCKGSLGTKSLGEVLVAFVLAQKLTLPKPSQQIQRSNLLQSVVTVPLITKLVSLVIARL